MCVHHYVCTVDLYEFVCSFDCLSVQGFVFVFVFVFVVHSVCVYVFMSECLFFCDGERA